MPGPYIKSVAKRTGKPIKELEKLWKEAKAIAAKKFKYGTNKYYSYTVGIFKRMIGEEDNKEK